MTITDHYQNHESDNDYEGIIKDFIRIVQEELTLITRSLVLYGSYAHYRKMGMNGKNDYFIPYESDLDLCLVVDAVELSDDSAELFKKVTDSLSNILFEPVYASIIDLTILDATIDIPPPFGANFGPLQMKAVIETGELLWGKLDVFKEEIDFIYSQPMLKLACRTQANTSWENIKEAFLHRDMYRPQELFWMGVDSVLDCAHTYTTFLNLKHSPFVRMEAAKFLVEQELDPEMTEIVSSAIQFRSRTKSIKGHYSFFESSVKFCRKINEKIIQNL
ncbi:MAG: hypothetical protein ACXAC7_06590 [Candidatus Hodarchaeales archaeon]|jgi:hypothetical protein